LTLDGPRRKRLRKTMETFLRVLLTGDRATALERARRELAHGGLEHVYEDLLKPALERIGELWEQGRLSLADEHVATAVVQATMTALYPEVRWPARGAKAVVATVPGEEHALGARMVSDLLALDGWDDVYVPCGASAQALAARVREEGAVLVALSVSLRSHVPALRATIEAIHRAAPGAKILAGGRGLHEVADGAELGVDLLQKEARRGVNDARRFKS